jgi:uncharacterized integral membrane protein (TIGR00697 family)
MQLITDPFKIRDAHHKYLDLMGMVWVTFLIIATITSAKTFDIGPFSFSVAVICYPITYIFADIFTEVYGYKKTRRIVWTGFCCLIISTLVPYAYAHVPPSPSFTDEAAFKTIFQSSPVLALAVVMCFFAGEFSNSYVLAKMKIFQNGRHLWLRLVASTLVGQTADNTVFYSVAWLLGGFYSLLELPNLIISTVIFCTLWEFLATPITYRIVAFLKHAEGLDIYDRGTNFNPFAVQ